MLLYRYLGSHAFETLRNQRLKVSLVTEFNDPFECMYRPIGEMNYNKAKRHVISRLDIPEFLDALIEARPKLENRLNARRFAASNVSLMAESLVAQFDEVKSATLETREDTVNRSMRIACFSAHDVLPRDEILIWSHYAGKHTGVRIGFEFPDRIKSPFIIKKIDYREQRVAIDVSLDVKHDALQEAIARSIRTKSTSWAYEKEYRLMTLPQMCVRESLESGKTIEHVPFNPAWAKCVDFGAKCPSDTINPLLEIIRRDLPHVVTRRAVYHPSQYALRYEAVPDAIS